MSGFEHAIEAGNAVLLVELGALCEIRDAIEILDLEKVRAPFGASSHNLGRHDLSEVL
jgi:hypothetical protein